MVMDRVVIGMDPHTRSVTMEARDTREVLRAIGTFGTDTGGYRGMLKVAHHPVTRSDAPGDGLWPTSSPSWPAPRHSSRR
jgi:hypothetical protein